VAGRIYLLKEDSKLLAMEEAPYDSERLLQKLLADHPDLLAGDQIDAEEPRRWLLVTREMAVPGEQDGAGRLAIEVKQFVGENLKTLVPRVVGQTETARQKKKVDRDEPRQWDETSFLLELSQRRGEQEAAVARRLLDWAKNHGLRVWWGQGKKDGSFFPSYNNRFGQHFLFSVWTYGNVELQFQHMKIPPFAEEGKRKELAQRLSVIGVSIPEEALKRRPTFGLSLLSTSGHLDAFIGAFDWVLSEIKKVETTAATPS
jgi:hypothetical protein